MKKTVKKSLAALMALLTFLCAIPMTATASDEFKEGYYTYEVVDNKARIVSFDKSIEGDIVIPDTLGGYTVEVILKRAFENSKIKSVVIPSSVNYIGIGAFNSSNNLESVTFENGERKLAISSMAFIDCKALSNISLFGNRVYAIASNAFDNTAFYNDSSNWESGVLYLNDIIISVGSRTIEKEYTVKDGTTTIADGATFIYFSSEKAEGEDLDENDFKEVKVTLPESVDNIGMISVLSCDKLPENIFRFGSAITNGSIYGQKMTVEMLEQYRDKTVAFFEKLNEMYEKEETPPEGLTLEMRKEVLKNTYIFATHLGWVKLAYNTTKTAVFFAEDGIIGLADETFGYMYGQYLTYNHLIPGIYNGLILPESFKVLSGYTALSDYLTTALGRQIYDNEEDMYAVNSSVTFLNPDCKIFDDENTLWDGYTICGYKGSTAEAYANKYGRKFVAIDDCKHEQTCLNLEIPATCADEGFSGDLHCQYCGELLEEGKKLPKTDNHDFEKKETLTYPSCTEAGTAKYVCKTCGKEEIRPEGEPSGHWFSSSYSYSATCTEDGHKIKICFLCGEKLDEITEKATGHKDENNDGCCDVCGTEICSHICHKDGISKLFYKIALIFWKLFRTNKYCSCGAAHY